MSSPTQAGERLLQTIGPRFEEIDAELAAVRDYREKPAGTIRITATEYAANAILLPKLAKLLPDYPDIKVEIIVDYGLSDIVAEGYDAGVRSGEQVAKDMIAVRIGPDLRMAVVGAPSYFRKRPEPKKPQDLIGHNCINLRLPTHGGMYAWEFEKGGRELKVRVEGQTDLQRRHPDAQRRAGGARPCLCARRHGAAASRQGASQAGACGLVPAILGLSPFLSEPAAVLGSVHTCGRRAAASRVIILRALCEERRGSGGSRTTAARAGAALQILKNNPMQRTPG